VWASEEPTARTVEETARAYVEAIDDLFYDLFRTNRELVVALSTTAAASCRCVSLTCSGTNEASRLTWSWSKRPQASRAVSDWQSTGRSTRRAYPGMRRHQRGQIS
jgi:hypothetical protein